MHLATSYHSRYLYGAINAVVGSVIVYRIVQGAIIAAVRKNLLALHGEVFAVAKKLYPDAKFIKLAP
jgi:hypothetical protein